MLVLYNRLCVCHVHDCSTCVVASLQLQGAVATAAGPAVQLTLVFAALCNTRALLLMNIMSRDAQVLLLSPQRCLPG
jgi:hypothetical protein